MLNPYVMLGAVLFWLASTGGAFFVGKHYEKNEWDAAVAQAQIDASKLAISQAQATTGVVSNESQQQVVVAEEKPAVQAVVAGHCDDAQPVVRRVRKPATASGGAKLPAVPGGTDAAAQSAPNDPGFADRLSAILSQCSVESVGLGGLEQAVIANGGAPVTPVGATP